MNLIDLSEYKNIEIGSTSRGTQKKWFQNGLWYKEDMLGYEGLAECIASRILKQSNVPSYAEYFPVKIKYDNVIRTGCFSANFKSSGSNIIPLQKLFRIYEGKSLSKVLAEIPDALDRIKFTVDFVSDNVDIQNFGEYLTAVLEFDGIILNEDRHFNNISVIISDSGVPSLCPIFDNGISLLSDLISYPLEDDIYAAMAKLEAKPFSRDFNEQIEAAEALYRPQLELNPCRSLIPAWLDELSDYYDDKILKRVERILREQFRIWNLK